MTFYAQWTKDKELTLTRTRTSRTSFHFANGGVFFDGNETLQYVTDGDGVARQPSPRPAGATFAG